MLKVVHTNVVTLHNDSCYLSLIFRDMHTKLKTILFTSVGITGNLQNPVHIAFKTHFLTQRYVWMETNATGLKRKEDRRRKNKTAKTANIMQIEEVT